MTTIILISPFPPVQNPRLLKEYQALKANGFKVKVWYAERDKWAANYNDKKNPDFKLIGGRYGSVFYYFTRLIHKILKNILPKSLGLNRVLWLLYLKVLTQKADLYIAHNSAALPIAVKAAQWHKTKCGFDAEDFHRQETTDNQTSQHYKTVKYLEDKYFPKLNYLTAASPLIAKWYKELYPSLNPIVINNVFSSKYIVLNNSLSNDQTLNLFWFSQTIGKNRGIEDAIVAIGILKNINIQLNLLGLINPSEKVYFKICAHQYGLELNQLIFLEPVQPDNIFIIASKFDVGLALEINIPFNRDICLTNKLFTYLTAGLAIAASETSAQKQFMHTHPSVGKSYKIGDTDGLAKIIDFYFHNREILMQFKKAALNLARNELNWEIESEKFLHTINSILC